MSLKNLVYSIRDWSLLTSYILRFDHVLSGAIHNRFIIKERN